MLHFLTKDYKEAKIYTENRGEGTEFPKTWSRINENLGWKIGPSTQGHIIYMLVLYKRNMVENKVTNKISIFKSYKRIWVTYQITVEPQLFYTLLFAPPPKRKIRRQAINKTKAFQTNKSNSFVFKADLFVGVIFCLFLSQQCPDSVAKYQHRKWNWWARFKFQMSVVFTFNTNAPWKTVWSYHYTLLPR